MCSPRYLLSVTAFKAFTRYWFVASFESWLAKVFERDVVENLVLNPTAELTRSRRGNALIFCTLTIRGQFAIMDYYREIKEQNFSYTN